MRSAPLFLIPGLLAAQSPSFTPEQAVQAEWARRAPSLDATRLSAADRARYDRALARIGAPGAPELLPPELAHPTQDLWEHLARIAKTPQARFTALFFLNRFKAPDALVALEGLTAADAAAWPEHLHLEAQVATARINGGEMKAELRSFMDMLQKEGKTDPVRAQAAQLQLIKNGKEKDLLPPVEVGPGNLLALLDSWNRFSWPARSEQTIAWLNGTPVLNGQDSGPILDWSPLGVKNMPRALMFGGLDGFQQRLLEGLPDPGPNALKLFVLASAQESTPYGMGSSPNLPMVRATALGAIGKYTNQISSQEAMAVAGTEPLFQAALLPSLRRINAGDADSLRAQLLVGSSSVARAAAIDDLPSPPADLDTLAKRCFEDSDLESALELFSALDRWKLSADQQRTVLTPFLHHPDWGWRYQAWLQLRKTDPTAPWPEAPAERPLDQALLKEAAHLATRGKPVRLRITFSGRRIVTLRLDPAVAPMNTANLVLLAKRRFFDGHRVPRVVPDFVVQMGSPLDTMDGGPGYSVRCEDSLAWYGPGSVGMALAGKDTGGCQFFITTNATPHLTGKYTRLGEVEHPDHDLKILDGLELGAKIESIRALD